MVTSLFSRCVHIASVLFVGLCTLGLTWLTYWFAFGWLGPVDTGFLLTMALGAISTGMLIWFVGMRQMDYLSEGYPMLVCSGSLLGATSSILAYPIIAVLAYIQAIFIHRPVQFPRDLVAYVLVAMIYALTLGFATAFFAALLGAAIAAATKYAATAMIDHVQRRPCFLRKCMLVQALLPA